MMMGSRRTSGEFGDTLAEIDWLRNNHVPCLSVVAFLKSWLQDVGS